MPVPFPPDLDQHLPSPPVSLVLILLALLAAGAIAYYRSLVEQRRRRQFAAIAARLGFSFSAKDPFHMVQTLPFELFDRGRRRKVHSVVYGRSPDGCELRGFEYQYTTGSGKNSRTYRWSCALVHTGAAWPELTLGPESFFTKIANLVLRDDIDFESDEFNRVWEVRGADRRFASAMIDPEMMLFLLEKAEGSQIEVCEGWVLYATERQTAEFLPRAIGLAQQFCQRVPPTVWSLYPAVAPADAAKE